MCLNKEPSNEWLIKDDNPNLRDKCALVSLPLSQEDDITMQKLIRYVTLSQDKKINAKLKLIPAVGLAAPQIGINKQMYYVHLKIADEKLITHALINPKIIAHSEQIACLQTGEGCLSVAKRHQGYVPRFFKVVIQGYDYFQKKSVTITAKGYEAIVLQHEQKHLDGKLYYDLINKTTPWKKDDDWLYL